MNSAINYSIELAMLKKLKLKALISDSEYELIKNNIDKKYKKIGRLLGN